MLCHATGNSETHFPIVYRYNLLMFFSPFCVPAPANFELSMELSISNNHQVASHIIHTMFFYKKYFIYFYLLLLPPERN